MRKPKGEIGPGALLRAARWKTGRTQRDVARATEIDVTLLSDLENDRRAATLRKIVRVAWELGIDPGPVLAARKPLPPELESLTAAQWLALEFWLE